MQSGKHWKKYKFILCYLSSSAPITLVTLKTPETPGVQDPVPRPIAVWGPRAWRTTTRPSGMSTCMLWNNVKGEVALVSPLLAGQPVGRWHWRRGGHQSGHDRCYRNTSTWMASWSPTTSSGTLLLSGMDHSIQSGSQLCFEQHVWSLPAPVHNTITEGSHSGCNETLMSSGSQVSDVWRGVSLEHSLVRVTWRCEQCWTQALFREILEWHSVHVSSGT